MIREPMLTTVAIADLRPTQITVGMREVVAKRKRWRETGTKKGQKFLGRHMIPVILGPKRRHYVIDHHHLALALHDEGVNEVAVTVVANLAGLRADEFWTVMDNRSWMHPFDAKGERRHYERHSQIGDRTGRRSVPLAGRRIASRGRLRQGHDAIFRISLGGFPAPARQAQDGRARLPARHGKGHAIGEEQDADYMPGWCGPVPEE